VADGKPEHSKIAREMKEYFDLDWSVDWLRTVVLTKWEQYTGIGKKRRAERPQKPAPEDTPATTLGEVDPQVLAGKPLQI